MRKQLPKQLLVIMGWLCIVIGAVGVVLPLLPTTPFLILALLAFSKSSPRYHQMLLANKWLGPILQQWESEGTVARAIKYKAMLIVVITFSISIYMLAHNGLLQLMLLALAGLVLSIIWRLKE